MFHCLSFFKVRLPILIKRLCACLNIFSFHSQSDKARYSWFVFPRCSCTIRLSSCTWRGGGDSCVCVKPRLPTVFAWHEAAWHCRGPCTHPAPETLQTCSHTQPAGRGGETSPNKRGRNVNIEKQEPQRPSLFLWRALPGTRWGTGEGEQEYWTFRVQQESALA